MKVFATHRLPDTIVTDNGTAFISVDFLDFTKKFEIRHIRSAPFQPVTNGLAEEIVLPIEAVSRQGFYY